MGQPQVDRDKSFWKFNFLLDRSERAFEAYNELSKRLVTASPFKRTAECGIALIVLSVVLALVNSFFIKTISFPTEMSIAMVFIGGLLLSVGVIAETWLRVVNLRNLSIQSQSITAEMVANQKAILEASTSDQITRING